MLSFSRYHGYLRVRAAQLPESVHHFFRQRDGIHTANEYIVTQLNNWNNIIVHSA